MRTINAIPVLAHPLKDISEGELAELLPQAISDGLMGIEVRHSSYNGEKARICDEIAEKFGLLKSGGSDFHGTAKPDVHLGTGKGEMRVPLEYYEKMEKYVAENAR